MALAGLKIIGESINDSVPSTHKLFEANDIDGLKELAKFQDEKGAEWLDVNVGVRPPEFMAQMVREVQAVTRKPLSIDTPDPALAKAGLDAYDRARANGKMPILNSISQMRTGMFEFYKKTPFMPILLLSERREGDESKPNRTAEEAYRTAKDLVAEAHRHGIPNDHIILDPGICPIGSDTEGLVKMVVGCVELTHEDPFFHGVHKSVGLSNFTVGIPAKKMDGTPVKGPLESAFLTLTMPFGLDMVVGSVKRNYEILQDDHPAMQCLEDFLKLEGHDGIMRLMEYYM